MRFLSFPIVQSVNFLRRKPDVSFAFVQTLLMRELIPFAVVLLRHAKMTRGCTVEALAIGQTVAWHRVIIIIVIIIDRFYIALFSALEQTHCARIMCDST